MFFSLRDKSYLEFVRQVFPDSKDPQRILKADPMDLSLPSLGRRYKFCLYNSYFLVQDSLWIQQPYQILLPPLYRLMDLFTTFFIKVGV